MENYDAIRELLQRVRMRWRRLRVFQAIIRAGLSATAVLVVALVAATWAARAPMALAVVGAAALVALAGALAWAFAPLRDVPSDRRLARFIEERAPALDDRLVSAVDVAAADRSKASFADLMIVDAAARSRAVDPGDIVPGETLRRFGIQACAAALLLVAAAFTSRERAREAYDAASLTVFPSRISLAVTPGDARVKAGMPLAIEARLVGNRAPLEAQAQIAAGSEWRTIPMTKSGPGQYRVGLESITAPFKYRVVAGTLTSATYSVAVVRAPRVTRIDLDYTFPASLGVKPRSEEDSGDIYAPAGTDVRVRIHTDRPAATGQLALADGHQVALAAESPTVLSGSLQVTEDNSYRVALTDRDGVSDPGDTEYFIRMLADRPPEVHIVKPASDRSVTRLEEVDVEAQADDDYGIERMELVYAVRGGPEHVVPIPVPPQAASVTAHRTLYLEDLNVQPGDFVSYYVRARDITRGKRSNEARSDIFFLEVKPFEQEFSLAQSQSMAGSGYNGSIDDLVNAQKQVVVATWKLDRRSRAVNGAQSADDIRSVGRTESDLKSKVEQTSSSFRESTMRDPRRRAQRSVAQAMPEEEEMAAAAEAMGRAVTSLNALKTGPALPPEMEALNHLLKAQAAVKKRQVQMSQSAAGAAGNNNRNYDVSTLFDKELRRQQETNYQTRPSAEEKNKPAGEALDKIRDLARRQDELLKRQQQVAQTKLSQEELKRELEKLTREQSELRQQAEELARQMSGQQSEPRQGQNSQGSQAKSGQQQSESGRQGQAGQQSQSGQSGADGGKRMRDVSEEMRNAASDLRRQDPRQASASGSRALDKLRQLQRQLEAQHPDERRRAIGELQLEARQLADAERQVASEVSKLGQGEAARDALRRLAGAQERLAERVGRLHDGLKQQAQGGAASSGDGDKTKSGERGAQASVGTAARDVERERIAERMQASASELRSAAGQPGGEKAVSGERSSGAAAAPKEGRSDTRAAAGTQQEIARALDRVADKLGAAAGSKDGESRKLSEQIARAQEVRERLESVSRELQRLNMNSQKAGASPNGDSPGRKSAGQAGKPGESGQQGGGTGSAADLSRLRDEYARQLQEARDLIDQMRQDDPTFGRGGAGFTWQGQGMTLSAPGTEAFKQDFAQWEQLRRQATSALQNAESSLSKKLQSAESKDRLAAGVDDKAPAEYQQQVDSYFKALATKKKND